MASGSIARALGSPRPARYPSSQAVFLGFERHVVRLGSCSFLLLGMLRDPGCGSSTTESASDGNGSSSGGATSPSTPSEDAFGAPPVASSSDAGAAPKAGLLGSPLCNLAPNVSECVPDEDGVTTRFASFESCAYVPTNNGPGARGCRLSRSEASATARPACQSANATGTDGVSCTTGGDCAPGFDCVEGDKGGTCRRYCCLDSCDGQAAQSGGKTFCDVQRLSGTSLSAPVCMPVKPCKLLAQGQCASAETCAIVNPEGDTGCVESGPASAGDACDTVHCAAGLGCIGQPGAKRCYQLCKVNAPGSCPAGTSCQTTSLFKEPAFGVCKKLTSAY